MNRRRQQWLSRCVVEVLEQRRLLAGDGLTAAYFDNIDLTNQKVTRVDATVNFNWGSGSPDATVGVDTFSARWTGQVEAQFSETYTFYTATDDGVRLWVNGVQLINKWQDQGGTEWAGTIALVAGQKYDITMEYYENGWGAAASLKWSSTSQAKQIIPQAQLYSQAGPGGPVGTGTGLEGKYYDNIDLTNLKVTRTDSAVNFNWAGASPDASVGVDTFSVRWSGQVQAQYSETYTFFTATDDGVRLWVNGVQLINKWQDQGGTEWSGTAALTAGQKYDIVMEYYENGWGALANLKWSSASTAKQIIPTSQLYIPGAVSDNEAPSIPGTPTLVSKTDKTANIQWAASTDNIGVTQYQVLRNGLQVGTSTTTSYADSGLSPSTIYSYTVKAVDAANNTSGASSPLMIVTDAGAPVGTGTGLEGKYYDNMDLTNLKVTRTDGAINFNWAGGTPDASVGVDTFSVRWSGQVQAQYSETYTFYTATDDGVRLWVNGVQLINKWVDQGGTEWAGTIALVAGQKYDIVMEYFENGWGALATLKWASPSTAKAIIPTSQLYGPAPAVPDFEAPSTPGTPTLVSKTDASVSIQWAASTDNIGVTGYIVYRDGVQAGTSATNNFTDTGLSQSTLYSYTVKATDATPNLSGFSGPLAVTTNATSSGTGTGLRGQYYDNMDLTGLVSVRTDANVNFNWGSGSPAPGVGVDTFSVRWSGQVQAQYSETYTFYTSSDDGARLWVNGVQLINKWQDQGGTEWSGTIALVAGQKYDIVMEYFDNGWGALAQLRWSSLSQAKQIIPTGQLYEPVAPTARSAYTLIEAESYDDGSGTQKNANDISSLDSGDWVKFSAIDFETGLASVKARLAVPASNSGGTIEFRADSPTGTILGTLVVQTTGTYSTFYTQKVNLTGATGVHDLYLVFRNKAALAVLDNIQFTKTALKKIMPLGDSITQGSVGYANYRWYLWQSLQTAGYNVDFVGSMTKVWNGSGEPPYYDFDQNNEGHATYTSASVASFVTTWASAAQPDIVLLHIGTNDIETGVGSSTILNNISLTIDRLRAVNPNVTVMVAQIIPATGYTTQIQNLNALIPAMVNSKNTAQSRIITVDQYSGFSSTVDTWDGIHPDNSGDPKMADRWYAALQTVL